MLHRTSGRNLTFHQLLKQSDEILSRDSRFFVLSSRLEHASQLATVFGTLVAVIAVYAAASQFSKGQEDAREARTVELFVKYNELMMQKPPTNEGNANPGKQAEYEAWRSNLAVSI